MRLIICFRNFITLRNLSALLIIGVLEVLYNGVVFEKMVHVRRRSQKSCSRCLTDSLSIKNPTFSVKKLKIYQIFYSDIFQSILYIHPFDYLIILCLSHCSQLFLSAVICNKDHNAARPQASLQIAYVQSAFFR